ncbi:DUF6894 family protein [Sphingopyxis sp. MSC1_008]|jgi:hypothetical protein|uniref:DUF6894 family protein n=1 Tax=Sphingopyxis sp. MSC1_008 TaxID=2909265 RepID=UPI0020BF9D79|nr:hypothetical protein [Sphingopyxis sp. MSC1_008]
MPRYYFHTSDGARDEDDVGVVLSDAAAARREAIRYGGSLLHDDPEIIDANGGLRIEVVDEDGVFCAAVLIQAVDARQAGRQAA